MRADPVRARLERAGDQMVEITVDHGYRPSSIVARAEVPLRLVFRRRDDDPCSERVVFSSPRLDRRLAPDADTTIVLPPQPAGEVRFTCGMGRYRGSIQLVPAPPRWGRARLRAEVSRLGDAIQHLMTAPAHDPSSHVIRHGDPHPAAARSAAPRALPRWLLPAVVVVAVAATLVALGVISLSTTLYAGLLGGMLLMHVGGHGGHGGHGGGETLEGPRGGTAAVTDDLSGRSPGSQVDEPPSAAGSDHRTTTDAHRNGKQDHDQHSSHACH